MSASETGGSVERVRSALLAAGHSDTITQFPAGTRTAADAAAAVGCTVAQIAKSIVFRCGMRAAVVITSGANRVDPAKAEAALGVKLGRADADWVRQATGFAIGGVGAGRSPGAADGAAGRGSDGARSDVGGGGVAEPCVPDHGRGTRADHRGEGGGGADVESDHAAICVHPREIMFARAARWRAVAVAAAPAATWDQPGRLIREQSATCSAR